MALHDLKVVLALALTLALSLTAPVAARESHHFLVVSSPSRSTIELVALPTTFAASDGLGGGGGDAVTSTFTHFKFKQPFGVAIDRARMVAYVSDIDPAVQAIYACPFTVATSGSGHTTLMQDMNSVTKVVHQVEARWLAVDHYGNLFFTQEAANKVSWVSSPRLTTLFEEIKKGGSSTPAPLMPALLYSGSIGLGRDMVHAPAGIATDGFRVFWANKMEAERVGTIVRAHEPSLSRMRSGGMRSSATLVLDPANPVQAVSLNAAKAYGVCLAGNTVYYTGEKSTIWGVKKEGGAIAEVNTGMGAPRGCVWDGSGTVFVADHAKNAIYSFGGSMPSLHPVSKLHKVTSIQQPEAVAFFSLHSSATGLMPSLMVVALAVFSAW